mgnify:FL=1
MSKKEFKAESKRVLDLMINSIYTNKEIFLRELISNASDAIDKLYYRSLTKKDVTLNQSSLEIDLKLDKENKNIIIKDNGCGMTEKELEENLGTIAKSGSLKFKEENEKKEDIDIIGQFGVGFYSSFMVSDKVTVKTKSPDDEKAHVWVSEGIDGYTIDECDKKDIGTEIILHLKDDTDDEKYSEFLDEYKVKELIKKYSDYIRYPIKMETTHTKLKEGTKDEYEDVKEMETLNSMTPLWKRKKSEITEEEYEDFYTSKFNDWEKPLKIIHIAVEGQYSYNALLFIPNHLPYDYYTKEYEKGLQLYSNGVLIMDKCADLLPDYYGFVKGLVDSQDLSLNISREMLQHDRQLKVMAKNIENKIKAELEKMLNENREEYEKFFAIYGTQLKFGTYADYGMNKDKLKDLLLFKSSKEEKLVTLKEYIERAKEGQDTIYYASGETVDKIKGLPQVESVSDKGYEILYLTENVDEFVLQILVEYEGKKFKNVCADNIDMGTEEEKAALKKINDENKEMLDTMKEALKGDVQDIKFTDRLTKHPVCLTTEGGLSIEMAKTINNQMGANEAVKAQTVLEINKDHVIVNKLKELFNSDKEELKKFTKILYSQARLIEGLTIENPTEYSNWICELLAK